MAEWTEKEWGPLRDMVFRLCEAPGTPGDEEEAAKAVEKEVRRCLPGAQIQRDSWEICWYILGIGRLPGRFYWTRIWIRLGCSSPAWRIPAFALGPLRRGGPAGLAGQCGDGAWQGTGLWDCVLQAAAFVEWGRG